MATLIEGPNGDLPSYDRQQATYPATAIPPRYDGVIQPRSAGSAVTTHTYTLNPRPNAHVTLVLKTSHAPSSENVPLFFVPDTIAGEVQLELTKTTAIKRLSVYVRPILFLSLFSVLPLYAPFCYGLDRLLKSFCTGCGRSWTYSYHTIAAGPKTSERVHRGLGAGTGPTRSERRILAVRIVQSSLLQYRYHYHHHYQQRQ